MGNLEKSGNCFYTLVVVAPSFSVCIASYFHDLLKLLTKCESRRICKNLISKSQGICLKNFLTTL